ncbi:MAG: PepSY domain-containing protein [Bacteroidales bacterium]|nr:PepSY domain-containing protein [Bacteroidales bacterium]
MGFIRKYHKWLGVLIVLLMVIFSVSGIILNHRQFFSTIDVSRKFLPNELQYQNWNNAAVKSTVKLNNGKILLYGNIGVWQTDSTFSEFVNFSQGFPKGVDNKKVSVVYQAYSGRLFAGSLFGFYEYDFEKSRWFLIRKTKNTSQIVDIIEKNNTLLLLSRSDITIFNLQANSYKKFMLPQPKNYDNKIGLFKTIWVIHSGEVWGETGKLIVDSAALILVFLTVTGLILFFKKRRILKESVTNEKRTSILKNIRWNLKWHNKIGWITAILLVITSLTGMFLRPPLLIPIAEKKVAKIPKTVLDNPNPWNDKLRRFIYDEKNERFYVATLGGIFYSDDFFSKPLKKLEVQPPVSVMGVNAFKLQRDSVVLVGSFEGLFTLNLKTNYIENYITKKPYIKPKKRGIPIGKEMLAGYSTDFSEEIWFDYNNGLISINNPAFNPEMPEKIQSLPISLWNVSLELHTGRIYKPFLGPFYILVVPLTGLISLFLIISGVIIWFRFFRNKKGSLQKQKRAVKK